MRVPRRRFVVVVFVNAVKWVWRSKGIGKAVKFRQTLCGLLKWLETVFGVLGVAQPVRYMERIRALLVADEQHTTGLDGGIVLLLICFCVAIAIPH